MKSNIQEQLRARELKPSDNSWEVLEARLDQHQKKGSNKRVLWFAAASVAALVVLMISIFKNDINEPAIPKERTVETTEEQAAPVSNPVLDNKKNESEMIAMPVEVEEVKEEVTPSLKRQEEFIASNVNLNKELHTDGSEEKVDDQLQMEQPFLAISEGVKAMDSNQVSDAELEGLLKDAQISMTMRKQREKRKADADWLLVEVEMELDKNFKDKVFDAIKDAVSNPKNTITKRDN